MLLVFSDYGSVDLTLTPVLGAISNWSWMADWRIVHVVLAMLSAAITFFLLNRALQKWALLGRLSNLPLFVAMVIYFSMPSTLNSVFFWVGSMIMLQMVDHTLNLLSGVKPDSNAFAASAMVGALLLFYPAFLLLYLAVLGAMFMAGEFSVRKLMITVVGLLLPSYFLFSMLYILPVSVPVDLEIFLPAFENLMLYAEHWWTVLYALFIAGCAMLVSAGQMTSSTLREKRRWQLIILIFALGFAAAFFAGPDLIMGLSFVPAVVIVSRLFVNHPTRWLLETFFIMLLGFVAINLFV